jgi:hypothetical protein
VADFSLLNFLLFGQPKKKSSPCNFPVDQQTRRIHKHNRSLRLGLFLVQREQLVQQELQALPDQPEPQEQAEQREQKDQRELQEHREQQEFRVQLVRVDQQALQELGVQLVQAEQPDLLALPVLPELLVEQELPE